MSSLSISQLFVHPLKSAKSVQSEQLLLDQHGALNDRRWMVVDRHGKFVSQRSVPSLCLVEAKLDSSNRLTLSAPSLPNCLVEFDSSDQIEVQIWNDGLIATDCGDIAAEWLSNHLAKPCRLVHLPSTATRQVDPTYAAIGTTVSFADGFPLLVIGQASLDHLNSQLATPIGMQRFRPNIVISGGTAHIEDGWKEIKIGEVSLSLVKPCSRCVIPSINPQTAKKRDDVIPTLSRYRRQGREINFGMNAIHKNTGIIRLGDHVEIIA